MIKLFRYLRLESVTKSKLKKYLLYAIGEIILVMIGILLALQVNNWREEALQKELEQKLLLEYRKELRYNLTSLDFATERAQQGEKSCDLILRYMSEQLPYTDSLSLHYRVLSMSYDGYVSTSAFETMKENGFDLIQDDSLKNKITQLHTYQLGRLSRRIENQMRNIQEYGRPILRHRLKALDGGKFGPLDYDDLMNDVHVWNTIHVIRGNYRNLQSVISKAQDQMRDVDEMISRYLVISQ